MPDRYTWMARIFPAYITLVPVMLTGSAFFPESPNYLHTGISALLLFPISYFLGQISSDFGIRLESDLWKSWGGPPTTRFLQHENEEFNAETRARIHTRLQKLGILVPTVEVEKANKKKALELYASAVDEMRRLTRDPQQFHLVHKNNIDYGFRRNLLGLKPFGILITILALIASGWLFIREWNTAELILSIPFAISLINFCVLLIWLTFVRKATVRIVADRYAHSLFEAFLNVEAPK